jgi:hypothetical protein
MSFLTQVEDLVGTIPVSLTDLGTALEAGATDIIRRVTLVNPAELWLFTKDSAVPTAGLALDSSVVVDVSRGSKPCKIIPPQKRHRASESDSIEYATGEFPVYYLLNGKVFVLPDVGAGADIDITTFATYNSGNQTQVTTAAHSFEAGSHISIAQSSPSGNQTYIGTHLVFEVIDATNFIINQNFDDNVEAGYSVSEAAALAQHLSYPAIVATAATIDDFPAAYYELVVLYGAMVVVFRQMADLHTGLPAITLPVVSVAPSISTPAQPLPVYTPPNAYVSPAQPASVDVDFTEVPATPVYTGPVAPSLPVLSFGVTNLDGITALPLSHEIPVIPESPSFSEGDVDYSTLVRAKVPAYTRPVFSPPTLPTIPALSVPPPPAGVSSASFSDPSVSGASSNQPNYTPPVLNVPDFTYIEDTLITAEEDSELASSMMQVVGGKIQQYQADMQGAINVFNKENGIYQQLVQQALANSKNTLDKENQEFQANLTRHNTEVQTYQADVNSLVQGWTKNHIEAGISFWGTKFQNYLAEYQQNIANEVNTFNKEVAEFQSEVQKATTDANNSMTRENNEYSAKLQKFNAELQQYQFKTTHDVTEWQAKVVQPTITLFNQDHTDKLAEWQGENTRILGLYQGKSAEAQAQFDTEIKIWSQEITKAMGQYSAETGLDLQQYQARMQEEVGRYQADSEKANASHKAQMEKAQQEIAQVQAENEGNLNKFQAEIAQYQAEVQAVIGEFQGKNEQAGVEYQWLTAKYQALSAQYNQGFLTKGKEKQDGR